MAGRNRIVTCIVNRAAGSNRCAHEASHLGELLERNRLDARVVIATAESDVTALAERAVTEGSDVVVGVGGDGTINAIANALVGTDVALGVVPLGTFDHFAKDLKIPLETEAAIATVASGETTRIDVGEVNGRVFLNNSSLGIYPWLVRQRAKLQRHGASKWRALLAALLSLFEYYPRLYVRLRTQERHERARETSFVFVGNNRYEVTGANVGGRQMLDRGQLWVCRAPRAGQLKLMWLALRALLGFKPKELETLAARELWIETGSKRARVATDGEISVLASPFQFVRRPGALKVIGPAGTAAPANA
jgi:diacylglycerol kinase family enzyme